VVFALIIVRVYGLCPKIVSKFEPVIGTLPDLGYGWSINKLMNGVFGKKRQD